MALINCKECGREISEKAITCPYCGARVGNGHSRKANKFFVIFCLSLAGVCILAIILLLAFSNKKSDTNSNTGIQNDFSSETSSEDEKVFRVGETAELNGVFVTMTDYKESDGSDWNKPSDGNVFVLVQFEIANNTGDEMTVSSLACFNAYADDYALNYSLKAMVEHQDNQLDGTLAEGKKIKGWIGWEVPQDYSSLEIHYTDSFWDSNKLVFIIEK